MNNGRETKFKEALKKASEKIKELEAEVSSLKQQEPIAIIGMACRFPGGAHTPEAFWNLLEQGKDMAADIPKDRWDIDKYYDPNPEAAGKMITRQAAFLDEVDTFDATFFEISPREVESLDPQHRLLLELSWEALEHAGLDVRKLKGSRTGVFMGMCAVDYVQLGLYSGEPQKINGYSVSGVSYSGACGRISYFFDFHGPSLLVDTACSSSLTALHSARQSLNKGESDLALVGGVSLLLSPDTFISFSRLEIISPDGRSRAFDQAANGFGRGEGGGVVVVKRLDDAIQDGDNILALVKTTAVNQDGKCNGFLAPNGAAQQQVIAEALKKADLSPTDIDYVETHGTGTPLGDPVEIQALANVFKKRENNLLVGSVKTNIGHLDAAAGIAGLIKVVLALQHNKIPPNLHFNTPSSYIPWEKIPIEVVSKIAPWEKRGKPRRAGISSFAFTGTNAHVVIEDPPLLQQPSNNRNPSYHILSFSTKKQDTLLSLAGKYKDYLAQNHHQNPADICYTSNISRGSLNHRFALVGSSTQDFIKKLTACLDKPERVAAVTSGGREFLDNRIVFMFTGQDSLYVGMGRELYQVHPLFKEEMDRCDALFHPHIRESIIRLLYDDKGGGPGINRAIHTQPIIFSVEYALTQLWKSWGIVPSAVVGHSIGEYAAACCAGVLTLEQAVPLVALRGKFMESLPQKGKMAGLLAGEDFVKPLIEPYKSSVSIAAVNAPENVTISGEPAAVDAVIQKVKSSGIFIEELNISHAFHSVLMEPYAAQLQQQIEEMNIPFSQPRIPMFSTKTGNLAARQEICTSLYWGTHLCDVVQFYDCMKTIENKGYRVFVEIGGTAALCGLAAQCAREKTAIFLPSLRKGKDACRQLYTTASQLYINGIDINWQAFHLPFQHRKVVLPPYPFERRRYWLTARPSKKKAALPAAAETVPLPTAAMAETIPLSTADTDTIQDQLKEMIEDIAGIASTDITGDTNLLSLGMDSVMLVQARGKIVQKYGVEISLNQFFTQLTTPDKITGYIVNLFHDKNTLSLPGKTGRETEPGQSEKKRKQTQRINFRHMKFEEDRLTGQQKEFIKKFVARYNQRTGKSKHYAEKYRPILSDWINTLNFHMSLKEVRYPIVSAHSQGSHFWDIDGNEYVDLSIGFGVDFFGHRPAFIVKAIEEQLKKGFELGTQMELAGQVTELICRMTGVERVTFCVAGSDAVTAALRLARTVTNRDKIVLFSWAFHGNSDSVLAFPGENGTISTSPGVSQGAVEDVLLFPYGEDETLDKIKNLGNQLAAVLVEPVQSLNPELQPKRFLKKLRKITEEIGAVLIFDEMITGFRICPGGAQEYFGVTADIVTYGKIIGGGMPIGIVAGKSRYMDAVDGGSWNYGDQSHPDKYVIHFTGTFCKHPFSMAGAYAALKYLKEQGPSLQQQLNKRTETFVDTLNTYFDRENIPLRIVNFGSLFRFKPFLKNKIPSTGSADLPLELDLLFYLLIERGVYTWEKRTCFFSTAHTDEDIQLIIKAVKECVTELRDSGFSLGKMTAAEEEFCFPMSSIQERLFVLSQLPGGEGAYHLSDATIITGPLDVEKIESVFLQLIQRHESLRTGFQLENDQFVQRVYDFDRVKSPFTYKKSSKTHIRQLISSFIRPFNLSEPPLIRLSIAELSHNTYLMVLDSHHIISDGLSMTILAQEVMSLYQGKTLIPVKKQYKNYAAWEQKYLDSGEFKTHEEFWFETLSGQLPRLGLPLDFPRPAWQSFQGATLHFQIGKDITGALKKMAGNTSTTLYMLLLAVFNVLLYKLTLQEDIILGTPIEVRGVSKQGDFDHTIGMFTNTILMRNNPCGNKPFREFSDEVKHHCLQAYDNREYPFKKLIETVGPDRDASHNPLFDVMFVYENANARVLKIEDLTFTPHHFEITTSLFDFTFEAIEEEGYLKINWYYNTKLFRQETIVTWEEYFEKITGEILRDQNILLADIELLSESEKQKILMEFNATEIDDPKDKTIHELFKEQVEQTPGNIAVVGPSPEAHRTYRTDTTNISYRELNDKSDRLAFLLIEKGVRPDTIVGIMVERSLEMIIGLLGILKAGSAYLPIDPEYPKERIDYMLADSAAKILLTSDAINPLRGRAAVVPTTTSTCRVNPTNLAYVIYTSGSTGQPKGVLIENKSIINTLLWQKKYYNLNSSDVVLQLPSYAFDSSVENIFTTLLSGSKLVIIREEKRLDLEYLRKTIQNNGVTQFIIIPGLYRMFLSEIPGSLTGVKNVILAGEGFTGQLVNQHFEKLNQVKLFNEYGPTENSVCTTVYQFKAHKPEVLIGKPIHNTHCLILDKEGNLCPIGIPGEICISGAGLARGYLNRPQLTAEKFCPGFYRSYTSYRTYIYLTGDLARWLPDGNIEFLGRIDRQVKIRGFRIELGEIEYRLSKLPGIKENVVIAKEINKNGQKELVAFFIPSSPSMEEDVNHPNSLAEYLGKYLPDYMIPNHFVKLEKIPLTPNGKIDRNALTGFQISDLEFQKEYVPPGNETEEKLVEIWQEVLQKEKIGINDNFFHLGGHSLKAVQIVSRIDKTLNTSIQLQDILQKATIKKIADLVEVVNWVNDPQKINSQEKESIIL